jgi:hypothetical protein
MNWLRKRLSAGLLLASGHVFAQETGVDVSFRDGGGLIYSVKPEAFTLHYPFGHMQPNGYVVPRSSQLRNGCFLSTPWLPVGHADGEATAAPLLSIEWRGELHPLLQPDQTLLRLQVEIRKADGTQFRMRSYVHTGLLNLQPRAYLEEGWVAYAGRLQGLLPPQEFSVSELDEIRYSVCDVYEGVKLTIGKLVLKTHPSF